MPGARKDDKRMGGDRRHTFFYTPLTRRKGQRRKPNTDPAKVKKNA